MKTVAAASMFVLLLPFHMAGAASGSPRRASLLQLQRLSRAAPAFSAKPGTAKLNMQGFCKRIDCVEEPCEPVCTEQPCCCWSTYAADKHPAYPSPEETASQQLCLYPPEGYVYAPDPGLTYNDGYFDELKRQGMTVYDNRRLCCLRRADGVQADSQQDLSVAVPTTTTTTALTTTTTLEVPPAFTTETFTTSLLNPGDEYENAQMEMAARAHLAAANAISSGMSALNNSAATLQEVNDELQQNPNLLRSREHVAKMRGAINDWAVRRWANLKRLSTGDASAFDDGPTAPAGLAPK